MKKLSEEDKKIWKIFTRNVSPLGQPENLINFPKKSQVIKDSPINSTKKYSAYIDLHGMTQNEAHTRLEKFICIQKHRKAKCILVITGKGYNKNKKGEPGVLKRLVPLWLEHISFVRSWSNACAQDGGEGALYVFLK